MRFMMLMFPGPKAEAGVMPDDKSVAAMMKYNEELVNSGVMLSGDGLHPSSKGARVRYAGGKPSVSDGPFTESKELIGGFAVMDLEGFDEVIAMSKRYAEILGGTLEVDVRVVEEIEGLPTAPEAPAS